MQQPYIIIIGSGYLGSAFAGLYRQQYPTVSVVQTSLSGRGNSIAVDITQPTSVAALAKKYPQPLFISIIVSTNRQKTVDSYYQNFYCGVQHIRQFFPNSYCLFTSSSSVYHQVNHQIVDEKSLTQPIKKSTLWLLQSEKIIAEMGGTVCRVTGIYGNDKSAILHNFLQQKTVLTPQLRYVNQVHVDDIADAFCFLVQSKLRDTVAGQTYNISNGQFISHQAIIDFLLNDSVLREQYLPYWQKQGFATTWQPSTAQTRTTQKRSVTSKKVAINKIMNIGWQPQYNDFLATSGQLMANLITK